MIFSDIFHRPCASRLAILLLVLACLVLTPAQAQIFGQKTKALLPEEQAFGVTAQVVDGRLVVNWSVAQDYYMYRDQFRIQTTDSSVTIGDIAFPQGEIEDDPEFGKVEVYFYNVQLSAPISGCLLYTSPSPRDLSTSRMPSSA